jgi:hypothetical protein
VNHPTASLFIQFSVKGRTLLGEVLAELSAEIGAEPILRKGRITEEGAWLDLELRGTATQFEAAFLSLEQAGVALHSYSILGADRAVARPALSAVAATPTLPPESFPRSRVAALAL